jgi:serine/threonine-protein kinase
MFDRELTDVLAMQDDIARAVVSALKMKLLRRHEPAAQERRTMNPDAYNEYLLGRQFARSGSKDGSRRAIEAYEKALAIDPGYAPAWAGLALARDYFAGYFEESLAVFRDTEERALTAAEKAIALDPDLAEGYHARGAIRSSYRWDWTGAQADYKQALALSPGDAGLLVGYADLVASLGRLQEAIALERTATELDPLRARTWSALGWMYRGTGQLDLARSATNRALEIAPDFAYPACGLGEIALLEGNPAAAVALYSRCGIRVLQLTGTAWAHHDLAHPRESQTALDTLIANFSQTGAYQIAQVYAWRGERKPAFQWLEQSYAQRDAGLRFVKYDAFLRNLRGDPRYAAFLRKMNLPVD